MDLLPPVRCFQNYPVMSLLTGQAELLSQRTQERVTFSFAFSVVGDAVRSEVFLVASGIPGFRYMLFSVLHPEDLGEDFPVELQGRVRGLFKDRDSLELELREFFHSDWFVRAVSRLSSCSPDPTKSPILVSCG